MTRRACIALSAIIAIFLSMAAPPAFALDPGDWLARVRGLWVDPIDIGLARDNGTPPQ